MQKNNSVTNWRGWYVAFLGAVTAAVSAAAASQFSTTLAPLAVKLGTAEEAVALTESVKSVVVIVAMLIAPAFIKKLGWKVTFILAFIAFLIPQIFIPYSSNITELAALKGLQGFSALLFPLALGLIIEWSDSRNVGLATSIFTGIFYAGGALGGTIAGFASTLWGWESSYHILSVTMTLMAGVYLATVSSKNERVKETEGSYGFVVRHRCTWFLILAFLPSVWTIQAIWADMVPFGLGLGYSEAQTGSVMGLSALAILTASLLSGKASDFFAACGRDRLKARVAVFAVGAFLIIFGVAVTILLKPMSPYLLFNLVVFLLSFGAAWGLGSFYCIFPEIYSGDQVTAANGFIGGIADVAMPFSPIVMAIVGIRMNHWNWAWFSCVIVSLFGLFFSWKLFREEN